MLVVHQDHCCPVLHLMTVISQSGAREKVRFWIFSFTQEIPNTYLE